MYTRSLLRNRKVFTGGSDLPLEKWLKWLKKSPGAHGGESIDEILPCFHELLDGGSIGMV